MAIPLRLAGIAMLLVLVSGLSAVPQTGRGLVEGVVVRFGSGEAITGVNLEMRRVEGTAAAPLGPAVFAEGRFSPGAVVVPSSANPSDIFRARTGADGRFVFTNLKPGKYRLLAAHPRGTYYPAEYGQRHPRGPGYDFVLDETQPLKVRLEMAPMASVSGRVLGADGRPAPHTHVMAAEVGYLNGQRVLNQVQGVETDDRGAYRLFWLPPGQYYIGAFPEGLRRRTSAVPFGPPGAVTSLNQNYSQPFIQYRNSGGETVEEVYETVYAPGEINLQLARLLDLRLGSNVNGVDISLATGRRRAARVRGVIIDGTTSKPAGDVSVRMVPRATGPVIFSLTATSDANGAFEIRGLMPGSYYAVATGDAKSNVPLSVQAMEIGGSNLDGVRLVITPGFSQSGRITLDDRPAEGYRMGLVPEVPGLPTPRVSAVAPGSFALNGTYPGNYRVTFTSPDVTSYLKSIRVGGVDVPDGELRVGDRPPGDLEIALGRNGGVVDGQVTDAQQNRPANVFVVLIPSNSRRSDLFKTARTDAEGHFRIQGVAPGSYLAFAWPWLPDGIWQYAEFIRTFQPRGKPVNIVEGSSSNVELVLLPELNF